MKPAEYPNFLLRECRFSILDRLNTYNETLNRATPFFVFVAGILMFHCRYSTSCLSADRKRHTHGKCSIGKIQDSMFLLNEYGIFSP